jgi:hypothetical protein
MLQPFLHTGFLALLGAQPQPAPDPPGADGYSLFRPKPRSELRSLSPDRPNTTESAISVDPGHVQLEISVADWTRERRDDLFVVLQTNLKFGLTETTDLQFVFDSYGVEDNAAGNDGEGFGDLSIRFKKNLWGNDGTGSAFAIFPYVKLPTGTQLSNDELEGGLILPYARPLTQDLALGLMAEFDVVYDAVDDDHDLEFLHSAVVTANVTDRLSQYSEFVGVAGERDYLAGLNLGLTYAPNPDLLLDAGVRLGLTDEREDFGLFAGFTWRY